MDSKRHSNDLSAMEILIKMIQSLLLQKQKEVRDFISHLKSLMLQHFLVINSIYHVRALTRTKKNDCLRTTSGNPCSKHRFLASSGSLTKCYKTNYRLKYHLCYNVFTRYSRIFYSSLSHAY